MLEDYLIVHKSILPTYMPLVLEAKRLIDTGKTPNVSQAVKEVGISRSTFYKYKDYILEPDTGIVARRAILSMMLNHETGVLSAVLSTISKALGSILSINQSLPIHNMANVNISLDISKVDSFESLISQIDLINGVRNLKVLAVE
ncbi:MAG: ACT domain-containing protein [Sphaerochaetaceae bacterium]|nr:ACT domain-containing protein [Sphaerochaetaceae bacterium]